MKQLIVGAIFTAVCAGLAFAADQRIDQRVQVAIGEFQQQEIERQIQFIIMKEAMAPEAVTMDDRVNKQVLERQLNQLRSE